MNTIIFLYILVHTFRRTKTNTIQINFIVFIIAQVIFYFYVVSKGPDKKLKEKLNRLKTMDGCSFVGENKDKKIDDHARRSKILKTALDSSAIPFIIAISIAFATMVHIDDFRVFFISNSFVLLSYLTEILLFNMVFEPYPFITDAEIIATLLNSKT